MSGGEKTRFKIAASFEDNGRIILADEPTSNLDIEGIELVEGVFSKHKGVIMIVSHDREFLDKVCNKILEIDESKVKMYKGNYSDYLNQKNMELEKEKFEYNEYQRKKKRLEKASRELDKKSNSTKNTPKRMGNSEARLHKMGNQKAKFSLDSAKKSVNTRIDKLYKVKAPRKIDAVKFDISTRNRVYSKILIEGKSINKKIGYKSLFENAEFSINNGSKVALVGKNGSGKTTLINMILEKNKDIDISNSLKIGYFSQDLKLLDEDLSILENVTKDSIYGETFVRTLLADLRFKGDYVYKKASKLSSGEKVKVSIAKILVGDFNFLILDEPTNYLDILSIEAIENALKNYNAAFLFVSHDRRFINSIADTIISIENKKLKTYSGTYEDFALSKGKNSNNKSKNSNKDDIEKQILILENKLSNTIGILSTLTKKDNKDELEDDYQNILKELKSLRELLNK